MVWRGSLRMQQGRFQRAEAVNFLNPEHPLKEKTAGRELAWTSVTTGNMAGIDLWLENGSTEVIELETHLGGGRFPASDIQQDGRVLEFGGLGRQVTLRRLPEQLPARITFEHSVRFAGPADLPVWVRVTQSDGHQAWSSPIYLIS